MNLLQETALRWPDRISVFHNDECRSFKDLHESADQLKIKLQQIIKLSGHGIALLTGNNIHFITGLFAASACGLVIMPVWKSLTANEIENSLKQSSIAMLLIEKNHNIIFETASQLKNLDENFDLIIFSGIISESITSNFPDAAFIRPSSGTTGNSKGVIVSHQSILERIEAANKGLEITEVDNILWVLPMAFHFIVSICLYVRYGAGIIICDDFLPETIIHQSNKYNATILYASPLHYRLLVSSKMDQQFTTIKKAISTSAGIENITIEKFQNKYNIPLLQAYGIIEIGLPLINSNLLNEKSTSVGKALPDYEVGILDDELNPLLSETAGHFAIRGPGMFSGYLWPYQKVEQVMRKGWFLTGDIAKMDKDGFVHILGRTKSVINVSGNKVFPEEVENILRMLPEIVDVRVFQNTHSLTGEIVQAEIVLMEGIEITQTEIISFCRKHLASIKIPQRILFVKRIQKTHTGKILRK